MRLGQQADYTERHEGLNIPEELARRQDRLEAITAAKKKIEQRADNAILRSSRSMSRRLQPVKKSRIKPGRNRAAPNQSCQQLPTSGPSDSDQVNLTDEESRIMPSGKSFVQAYNAQAGVDVDSMLIASSHVSQSANDQQ